MRPLVFFGILLFFQISIVAKTIPPVAHPKLGAEQTNKFLSIKSIEKKQNFKGDKESRDKSIYSPKSTKFRPDGVKYYVNSLEGAATIAYDAFTNEKLAVIRHHYSKKDSTLWGTPSKFYNPPKSVLKKGAAFNTFYGKPVESVFSHDGQYLWIPFYRRNFDTNAQYPSAMAVINTDLDEVVRLIATGPIPKMVTVSPDGNFLVVTHWGDNTVGIIDISSDNPMEWATIANVPVGKQLKMNFSVQKKVNRDVACGSCLRGTTFTPDGKYLLVAAMKTGLIGVIDFEKKKYLGMIHGAIPKVRHLIVSGDFLYASVDRTGYVERIPLDKLYSAIDKMKNKKVTLKGWQKIKVGGGARTIAVSPDGQYIFAACNVSSSVYVISLREKQMKIVMKVPVDSYPVGLDISPFGDVFAVTSQGRSGHGGNAVNIYSIDYGLINYQ